MMDHFARMRYRGTRGPEKEIALRRPRAALLEMDSSLASARQAHNQAFLRILISG
jgi:hypothetical protein